MDKGKKIYSKSTIVSNNEIQKDIYEMIMENKEIAQACLPGQFIEIFVNNQSMILPRPISICDVSKEKGHIAIVYQVLGKGTAEFSKLKTYDEIRVVGPLGNGFELVNKENYALMGGGVGVPPLLYLCKELLKTNPKARITVFLGYRDEPFLAEKFQNLGLGVSVNTATDSGKHGFKGNIVDCFNNVCDTGVNFGYIYSCGPKIMLKSLAQSAKNKNIPCQVSMEERIACGIGACVGCVVKIKSLQSPDLWEYKKVCKDGPVFDSQEVVWDD